MIGDKIDLKLIRVHQGKVSSKEAADLLKRQEIADNDLLPGQYEGILQDPLLIECRWHSFDIKTR